MKLFRACLESMSGDQLLYHYSDQKFHELKTREITTTVTAKDREIAKEDVELRKMPGAYYEHISFFFERPPIEKMSQIFDDHPFWYPGHQIYEHIVSVNDLPAFAYVVVESPEVNDFFYDERNDALSDKRYYEEIYKIRKRNGEIGDDPVEFKKAIQRLKGTVENAYLELSQRPNFESIKKKYAATVPHVMLYPKGSVVQVKSIKQVIVL